MNNSIKSGDFDFITEYYKIWNIRLTITMYVMNYISKK